LPSANPIQVQVSIEVYGINNVDTVAGFAEISA